MLSVAFAILLLGFIEPAFASRLHNSFKQFLPGFGPEISGIVRNKCLAQYQAYQNETLTVYGTQCVKTYSCIMAEVTEYTKANMQASAVLL